MSGAPFTLSALGLDLSPRIAVSTAIVGSPALAAETIVASVTVPGGLSYASGVALIAYCAFTPGTSGVTATFNIRRTSISGTQIATTPALTVVAADPIAVPVFGFDTAPGDSQVYKLTLTVGSGAAASTVGNVMLAAVAI